jgi:hypothetical protein
MKMRAFYPVRICPAACAGLVVLLSIAGITLRCGSRKKEDTRRVALIGTDTLTVERYIRMTRDSTLSHDNIADAISAITLARSVTQDDLLDSGALSDIDQRLSSESGYRWETRDIMLYYKSATALARQIGYLHSTEEIFAYADSLFASRKQYGDSLKPVDSDILYAVIDSLFTRDKKENLVVYLLQHLCGLSPENAMTFTHYIQWRKPPESKSQDVAEMVDGLIYTPPESKSQDVAEMVDGLIYTPPEKAPIRTLKKRTPAVSTETLLRYRSMESIKDSIKNHLPNLEALYRKVLKMDKMLSGTVWVRFTLTPSGRVEHVEIQQNDMNDSLFVMPFQRYLHTIHFKSIPENLGPMSFIFPFEFTPEM